MDISFATLHQKAQNGKIVLQYDSVAGQAFYERTVRNDDDEIVSTKRIYLPPLADIQTTLTATGNERQGLIFVRDFYQAQ